MIKDYVDTNETVIAELKDTLNTCIITDKKIYLEKKESILAMEHEKSFEVASIKDVVTVAFKRKVPKSLFAVGCIFGVFAFVFQMAENALKTILPWWPRSFVLIFSVIGIVCLILTLILTKTSLTFGLTNKELPTVNKKALTKEKLKEIITLVFEAKHNAKP